MYPIPGAYDGCCFGCDHGEGISSAIQARLWGRLETEDGWPLRNDLLSIAVNQPGQQFVLSANRLKVRAEGWTVAVRRLSGAHAGSGEGTLETDLRDDGPMVRNPIEAPDLPRLVVQLDAPVPAHRVSVLEARDPRRT